jgi:nicotinate-nucleotide adenylyltransferase
LKRIGIFGGTFDPVHHAHLILAREAREAMDLEAVIFVPAAVSPHKSGQQITSNNIRLKMLLAALEGEPGFHCDEIEIQRPPPSYAVETIAAMRGQQPTAEFFYLIGEDNVDRLSTWHRFNDLKQMVQFVVLSRSGRVSEHDYPTVVRQVDISATDIRNRVASGRSIRYLVPAKIEQIIYDRQLYREAKTLPRKI